MDKTEKIPKSDKKEILIYNTSNHDANLVDNLDYNDYLNIPPKNTTLEGFDSEYKDFVDYIMKITHRIWEEKGIGIIYDTYHNNVSMHFGSHNSVGIKNVISGTLQTLHAFPDRRLIGQNVIWSKDGSSSYLSSHRILSTATNLGDSSFGEATGKRVHFRTTVDCLAKNNRIYEEWLVRDNLWIVKQLGYDPVELAKKMAKATVVKNSIGLDENMTGQFMPAEYTRNDESVGELMKEMLSKVYGKRLFNEVRSYYHQNAVCHFICDQDLIGHQQIQGMLVSLFSSFPNANFKIDRITVNEREMEHDVAVRWYLSGMNEGIGYFGQPTGNTVQILGITHYRIAQGKIAEEWVTFDGLDVLRQLHINNDIVKNKED